ncbi:phytoene desaturase family protein [Planococcus sp. ISL-109]|uniref:phytoene desaturase family protein n=1 Tax=Planococcus sp. ISL-109 TaxID=2819166 RepID=UPI002035D611|nr:phytoene desaturase family protein [Planococcus sp. ISL-109]
MNRQHIAIVGGGLGGLAAAVTLAHAGMRVSLFEKNSHFGGKLMPVELGSYRFDFGPNTITMPGLFQQVIAQTGRNPEDYFQLEKLAVHTRNHFTDGSHIDFTADREDMIRQLETLDPFAAERYPDFLAETERLYRLSEQYFFPLSFQSFRDYLSPALGKALLQVRPYESMDRFFSRYFKHAGLRQAFGRYATYIGSSPYKAPATFAMIAHLELAQGVFYAKGGNTSIAEGFAAVAAECGAELHADTAVTRILTKKGAACGVELADGRTVEADAVILNGDLLSAFPELVDEQERPSFRDAKRNKFEPSISAFVITAGLDIRLPELKHHNVFFSADYPREFRELFADKNYSGDPTIYISNSSHTDSAVSPLGDNLFILVNAPALTADGQLQVDPERYKNRIYDLLEHYGIFIRGHIKEERIFTPAFICDKFGSYRGALYGPSSNRPQDAFLRPANASRDVKGLYFVGGSVHPGGGSPMVTLSGLNVARRLIRNYS